MINTLSPLADRIRPTQIDEIIGQDQLLAPNKPLRQLLDSGRIHSLVLWGPSGTGKTTLARIMANYVDAHWLSVSAVQSGIKEIRQVIATAVINRENGQRTVVFVDEVHRFNKVQQDAFLPYIEDATIIFIGATTENPSFELNAALLSRCRVFLLKAILASDLLKIIDRGIADLTQNKNNLIVTIKVKSLIVELADGDARRALNLLEICVDSLSPSSHELPESHVLQAAGSRLLNYDKGGDQFYEQISAFHKSIRGSNPDAGLYWLARMICAGCDPFYIARRLTVIASEDIGNADPRALTVAIDAWDALKRLGQPEGEFALAQATTYLASAPKSNASYQGYKMAKDAALSSGSLPVPIHLRNSVTILQKKRVYKSQYHYAHDDPMGYSPGQSYMPAELADQQYYFPVQRGLESKISQRLNHLHDLDLKQRGSVSRNQVVKNNDDE